MIAVEKTKRVKLSELKPYPKNPRKGDVAAIVESLEAHGQYRALVVNARTNEVLAGNHTFRALEEMGAAEALVHFVDVDEDEAARIVLVDNRSNDVAGYDDVALLDLLRSLPDLGGTGYSDGDLDRMLTVLNAAERPSGDTAAGEPPVEPRTKLGDLYWLGQHRLLCGDSTTADAYDCVLAGAEPQMVFTDPPYGVDYRGGMKRRKGLAGDQRGTDIYHESLPFMVAHAKADAAFYVWYADLSIAAAAAAAAAGLQVRGQVVWVKNNAQFMNNAHYHGKHEPCIYASRPERAPAWFGPKNEVTVWTYDRAPSNDFHPTQKPVALAERAAGNSTRFGNAVLDPFGGSGSTLIACENTGRVAHLIELDPGYCDVIVDRWERHTGKKAKLDG